MGYEQSINVGSGNNEKGLIYGIAKGCHVEYVRGHCPVGIERSLNGVVEVVSMLRVYE